MPRGVRLVHLSCDLVFSGDDGRGGYVETDPTDPVTVYGKTMAAGEEAILAADPTACILRISLPMGVSFSGHAGAIDWITSRFKKSRPATLYFDEIRTPTYTDCLNRLCETMLANELSGIFHAGAPRRLSLYQIAQIINRVGGYDPDCLMGIPRHEAGPIPPRAGNVCMDCSKLIAALGYDPFDPVALLRFARAHARRLAPRAARRRAAFAAAVAESALPKPPPQGRVRAGRKGTGPCFRPTSVGLSVSIRRKMDQSPPCERLPSFQSR